MNFEKLLNVADSNKIAAQSEASVKRYSTVLAPPKKPPKANVQSDAIKRFLAKKDEEERQRVLEARKKKEELLCLRAQNTKSSKKAKIMASRTKDNDFSKIRMTDDDLVAKKERELKILRMSLDNKRERMKARIDMADEEKQLPHKRKRKSKHNASDVEEPEDHFYSENRNGERGNSTFKSRGEFHSQSDGGFSTKETNRRSKPNLSHASAPPVSFHDLLKMAETNKYQPVELPKVKIPDTDERPLTKKEMSLLRAEDARLRRKMALNDEQDMTNSKTIPPHAKSKNPVLNGKNVDQSKRVHGLSQKFSNSGGDIEGNVPQVRSFHIPKHNSNNSVANKNSRNFSSKTDNYENSTSQYDNVKGNFHHKHAERNSSEQKRQSHHDAPPRQKAISKTSEKYVGVQNGQRRPANDVRQFQQTENSSAPRKVPHSNHLQNTRSPKSASVGNSSEGFKRPFSNSENEVNMQRERNSRPSNVQSVKTTSHIRALGEHRPNSATVENMKGTKLSKSMSSHHKLSSNHRLADKSGEFTNSSAISSNREIHSSSIRKNTVSTKVPGKMPNTRDAGYASHGRDIGQRSTSSDNRLKNGGKLPFESQEKMHNVRRYDENPFAKEKGVRERSTPVNKHGVKPEIMKRPPSSSKLPPARPPPSSTKLPPTRPPPSSAKLPPARPPSSSKLPPSRPPSSSAKLPPTRPPLSSAKLPPVRPPSSSAKLPPARPPSSSAKLPPARPPSSSAKLPPSRPPSSSAKLPPSRPPLPSAKFPPARPLSSKLLPARSPSSGTLSPARPPIKHSSYPRNPYLDPPRRLLESRRPQKMPIKRRIESDEDDDEDDSMSDFIDDNPTDDRVVVSKYIKEIFNYDRSRYLYEEDDDEVMETSYAEQIKEEVRSAKIGRQEDLEDMRLEEEEKKRKKKKLKK